MGSDCCSQRPQAAVPVPAPAQAPPQVPAWRLRWRLQGGARLWGRGPSWLSAQWHWTQVRCVAGEEGPLLRAPEQLRDPLPVPGRPKTLPWVWACVGLRPGGGGQGPTMKPPERGSGQAPEVTQLRVRCVRGGCCLGAALAQGPPRAPLLHRGLPPHVVPATHSLSSLQARPSPPCRLGLLPRPVSSLDTARHRAQELPKCRLLQKALLDGTLASLPYILLLYSSLFKKMVRDSQCIILPSRVSPRLRRPALVPLSRESGWHLPVPWPRPLC